MLLYIRILTCALPLHILCHALITASPAVKCILQKRSEKNARLVQEIAVVNAKPLLTMSWHTNKLWLIDREIQCNMTHFGLGTGQKCSLVWFLERLVGNLDALSKIGELFTRVLVNRGSTVDREEDESDKETNVLGNPVLAQMWSSHISFYAIQARV
ncbi:uncharacterized protein BJ212DRAFT_1302040 [Suillus subaureus]|uniref:Uncharacterized protein n=1 Tax=Suillus subaureus TaxID=48587 RepID=A0A9P7E597_9AGAM|nr:uncharacterized protein BJ212DRAFT_1302040 [Suillus subaureus]KAG1811127.1 hypothetical protein BJ212DRAFT_1302040 [Suillus subaureus]